MLVIGVNHVLPWHHDAIWSSGMIDLEITKFRMSRQGEKYSPGSEVAFSLTVKVSEHMLHAC